jgi:uncharacterized membrane protein YgdD (TMEM256/DUF423 family)
VARWFIILAAFSGMLAVGIGAFGAHALKSHLDEYALSIYQTAVQYQFYHSLALLGVGLLCLWYPQSRLLLASGIAFFAGILVFSGSLYLLSFTGIRWLGAITPIGGLAFIAGWVLLLVTAWGLPEAQ